MGDYETAQDLFDALSAPFPPDAIEWRVGTTNKKWRKEGEPLKGTPLCYIDARTAMDRLDTVCGPDGWQCNYSAGVATSVVCNIGIRIPSGEWLWKADGAGATDMEGEKGMLSDAFKRAAVRWGVGRYLYGIAAEKIVLEESGRIPKEAMKKLDEIYETEAKKCGWGSPTDVATYRFLLHVVREHVTQPSDVIDFREKNKSMFSLLRVSQRRHLEQELDRIGGAQQENAA